MDYRPKSVVVITSVLNLGNAHLDRISNGTLLVRKGMLARVIDDDSRQAVLVEFQYPIVRNDSDVNINTNGYGQGKLRHCCYINKSAITAVRNHSNGTILSHTSLVDNANFCNHLRKHYIPSDEPKVIGWLDMETGQRYESKKAYESMISCQKAFDTASRPHKSIGKIGKIDLNPHTEDELLLLL